MSNDTKNIPAPSHRNDSTTDRALMIGEIALTFVLFAVYSGQAPPDINETHYLAKAKHFWNPDWCAGDIFLESTNAHWLFYVTFGWLTLFLSLPTVAWAGRLLTWLLTAIAWQRMCRAWNPMHWLAPISALLFLIFNSQFHLAGEWVIGGLEAKGIAYFLVTLAIADALEQNWRRVWLWLGAAAAFHVLVGGWAMLILTACWTATHWPNHANRWHEARRQTLPWLAGLGLSLIGVLPPLLADQATTADQMTQANWIYVNQRIAHHLHFSSFSTARVASFALLTIVWLGVFLYCRKHWVETRRRTNLLFYFGLGSLALSICGLTLSGMAESNSRWTDFSVGLLKFYWFRMADFAIPATLSLALAQIMGMGLSSSCCKSRPVISWLLMATALVALSLKVYQRYQDPRPIGDRRSLPTYAGQQVRTVQTFDNWKNVCRWIRYNTPSDSVFITPCEQQSFKWYAHRAEVVNWKDVPQNAAGLLEWRTRVERLIEPQKKYAMGLMVYSDEQLTELARVYQADFLLLPQRQLDLSPAPTTLPQVYPKNPRSKSTYAVFRFQTP